jgi:hypothetical protein
MKSFRTDVSITKSSRPIGLKNPVLTIGSCFADAIGARLLKYKFSVTPNPFGVIYNPVSIHTLLNYAVDNHTPVAESYLESNGLHLNYNFHSELSAPQQSELEEKLKHRVEYVHKFLNGDPIIIITYGTAWVYQRTDTCSVVANCHKMPSTLFIKKLLTENQIVDSFTELYNRLKSAYPAIRIILTISPVRHLKDTLELNSLSKAVLRTSCHHLTSAFNDVEYFPAFEIMTDDLRDYRFYKKDMIHPSDEAEDYIWEKFTEKYFDMDTIKLLAQWDVVLSAIHHKPFHPTSPAHQAFLKDTLSKLEALKSQLDVQHEIANLKLQITQSLIK